MGGGGHIFNKTVTFEKRGNDWGNESVKSKKEEKDKGFDKHVKEEKCFVDLSAVFFASKRHLFQMKRGTKSDLVVFGKKIPPGLFNPAGGVLKNSG